MTFHRKIGGIHWFALGRLRVSVCLCKHSAPHKRPRTTKAKLETLRQALGIVPAGLASQGHMSEARRIPAPIKLPRTSMFPWPPEAKQ